MDKRPTYEELEQKVKKLEQEKRENNLIKEPTNRESVLTNNVESENNPENHIPEVDLESIINAEEIQSIMDDFCSLTGMVTAILDLKGKVIESTGWKDLCTQFHRVNPKTARNCTESDLFLAKNIKAGEYIDYKCKNGLWDVVTPLYVGTKHLGNIYSGQFFYDDEPVDENFFIKQAEIYGFDKDSYLDAFRSIPKYNRKTIKYLMSFLVKFTTYISEISYAKLRLQNEIHVRKQAEEALQESIAEAQRLRDALELVPACIYMKDMQSRYIYANRPTLKLFGCSAEELIGCDDTRFFPPETVTQLRQIDLRVLDGEQTTVEVDVPDEGDGRRVYLEIKAPIYEDVEQKVIAGILGISTDITERKDAEDELLTEKERLAVTLRSIGDGVITTDTNGNVVMLNKVAETLTGWLQKEALGKDIKKVFNIISVKTRKKCENPVKKVLEAKTIVELANHTNLISRDGTERMIADSGAPIFDANSEIIGVILVFRDITEKHKIEKQLQQSQKMESIGTLAGGIAHDFNNMLGVITGNISYALNNLNKNDELYEVLSDVQESSKQAQNLTHQLLTFSKGGEPIKKVADINKLISETAIFSIRGANAKCNFELSNDLWSTEIDEGQINQVIGNLIINANQAMPNGGIITIRTENTEIENENGLPLTAGRYVKIVVEDQGVGISKKHLSNIFEPYFTTKQKGSGLGLATTYSIINKHGGNITVYSEIDKGTVFNIYLPASSKNVEEIENKKELQHTGHGKILIMDDQESILKMVGRMLNKMGYEAVFATDGSQAVKMYKEAQSFENSFDLVILDLTVPGGMGGLKTIIELLKIDSNVKAIVSSGYSNDPIMANYEDYGFCGVVPKPYTKDQLAEVLNKIFSEKK